MKNPFVQTVLARFATNYLEAKLNTTVKIARLEFNPLKRIALKKLLVLDRHQDTLLYAGELKVGWKKLSLKNTKLEPTSVYLQDANIKLIKYINEEMINFSFIAEAFATDVEVPADTAQPSSFLFQLKQADLSNCRFIYENQNDTSQTDGINFSSIGIMLENFETGEVKIHGDSIFADIKQLKLKEKSGFEVNSFSGNVTFSTTYLQAEDLHITTPNNDISLNFRFNYDSMESYNDFIHKVKIQAEIKPTILNLYDIGYFAPVLFDMDNRIEIKGIVSGTVNNFKARDFEFSFGDETHFDGNIQMNGLPDFFTTFIHLSVNQLTTQLSDITEFNLPIESRRLELPDFLYELGIINITGKFTGFYNDFVSYGNFNTDLGQLKTDILMKVNAQEDIEYKGNIVTKDLNIGSMFNLEEYLNKLSVQAEVRGKGIEFESMEITLNGLIQSIDFYGNTYNDISLTGNLDEKKFNGQVNINDELIDLDFNGIIDYSQLIPAYQFVAVIDSAYLNQMNLIEQDSSMILSTKLDIDLSGNQFDNLQGIVKLDSTRYSENGKLYKMDDFTLSVTRDGSEYSLFRLFSDFADVSVEGKILFREMPLHITQYLNQYLDTLMADVPASDIMLNTQDFTFDVEVKKADPLMELIFPELKMAEGTRITGGFNSKISNLFFDIKSSEIEYSNIRFNSFNAEFLTRDKDFTLSTFTGKVYITDTLSIDSIQSNFIVEDDSVIYAFKWNNLNWETSNFGDFEGNLKFLSPKEMEVQFRRGEIVINDTVWEIIPENLIKIDTSSLSFTNFGLISANQGLRLSGKVSSNPIDTLAILFDQFNLSQTDRFLSKSGIDLDGIINGNFNIIDFYHTPNYISDITITGLGFNKEVLGDAILKNSWDPKQEAFGILAQIIYEGNVGKIKTLEVSGKYFPNREDNNYNIKIDLNNYKLKTLEPFVIDFSSKVAGEATGELVLSGSTDKPVLTGDIGLKRTNLKIDYLNVTYSLADQIHFKENLIYFDNIIVYDSIANEVAATGKIHHNYFQDFVLDLNFTTKKIIGLNTTRQQNEIFYGSALASGSFKISGPPDNLKMDINVKSEKGTSIKIPASYGSEVANNEFVVYIDQDEKTIAAVRDYEVDLKGLALNLGLNVTHDANIQLFLPYQMGNIQATGNGDLFMNIDPSGKFKMEGQYIIDKGSFFLTLQNIINRDFNIRRGSKIVWSGDPYNAQIDLKAVYRIKTTLGDYAPIEDSASRVQVDCIIALSKSLFNPEIRFSIEFPDLKEDSKQYIYSQLDTTNQALMSQQMISLLLLNSFYFPTGTTGSVGFNTFSLVTNQLNNWLSGFSDNLDIGVNYTPGGQLNEDEVEVALSTRLFDDRVSIDGNVGYKGQKNTSNLIGEVTVEVKITDDGRFRAKVFNKSNNDDLYKNYSPYTQGVGVFYTQDFNRFGDIFRRKKKND